MDKDSLPLKVDPFRFADNSLSLSGTLLINEMQRLCLSLSRPDGQVDVDLAFGIDEQGLRFLKGHLTTSLELQCQRCLMPFNYAIISSFLFAIIASNEEAEELPGRYDPLIVKDNELFIRDIVEEELIIALPIVPMHNLNECQVKLPYESSNSLGADVKKESPFKVIESLRSKRDSKRS